MDFIKEFFRFTENYKGKYLGPAHLTLAIIVMLLMVFLGIYLGLKFKNNETKQKKFILICAIIL